MKYLGSAVIWQEKHTKFKKNISFTFILNFGATVLAPTGASQITGYLIQGYVPYVMFKFNFYIPFFGQS